MAGLRTVDAAVADQAGPYSAVIAVAGVPCVVGIRLAGDRLAAVDLLDPVRSAPSVEDPAARPFVEAISRYLAGDAGPMDLPVAPAGTAYQRGVWAALRRIPWGETRTYAQVAREAGGSPRSVGAACAANPTPLAVPCHRVVSAVGVGGFMGASAGGPVDLKQWLLRHEGWQPAAH